MFEGSEATHSKVLQKVISMILYLFKLSVNFYEEIKLFQTHNVFKKLPESILSQEVILSVRNCIVIEPIAVSLNT